MTAQPSSPAPLRRAGIDNASHERAEHCHSGLLRHRLLLPGGVESAYLHYHLPNAGWWRRLLKALVPSNHFPSYRHLAKKDDVHHIG
jgi:hypothetical protein